MMVVLVMLIIEPLDDALKSTLDVHVHLEVELSRGCDRTIMLSRMTVESGGRDSGRVELR